MPHLRQDSFPLARASAKPNILKAATQLKQWAGHRAPAHLPLKLHLHPAAWAGRACQPFILHPRNSYKLRGQTEGQADQE